MKNNSLPELQKFISQNTLSPHQKIILFNAAVTFYQESKPITIISEIQIIRLPKEMVLYVHDFANDGHHESEIYSTSLYHFENKSNNTLEVRGSDGQVLLVAGLPHQ